MQVYSVQQSGSSSSSGATEKAEWRQKQGFAGRAGMGALAEGPEIPSAERDHSVGRHSAAQHSGRLGASGPGRRLPQLLCGLSVGQWVQLCKPATWSLRELASVTEARQRQLPAPDMAQKVSCVEPHQSLRFRLLSSHSGRMEHTALCAASSRSLQWVSGRGAWLGGQKLGRNGKTMRRAHRCRASCPAALQRRLHTHVPPNQCTPRTTTRTWR